MSVGYTRNNVDYIPDDGTETGYVNKAECIELIKTYTQDIVPFVNIRLVSVSKCNPMYETTDIHNQPFIHRIYTIYSIYIIYLSLYLLTKRTHL